MPGQLGRQLGQTIWARTISRCNGAGSMSMNNSCPKSVYRRRTNATQLDAAAIAGAYSWLWIECSATAQSDLARVAGAWRSRSADSICAARGNNGGMDTWWQTGEQAGWDVEVWSLCGSERAAAVRRAAALAALSAAACFSGALESGAGACKGDVLDAHAYVLGLTCEVRRAFCGGVRRGSMPRRRCCR